MSINDLLTLSISELHSIYGGAKKHKNIIEIEKYEFEDNVDDNYEFDEPTHFDEFENNDNLEDNDEFDEPTHNDEIVTFDDEDELEILGGTIDDVLEEDDFETIEGVTFDDFDE